MTNSGRLSNTQGPKGNKDVTKGDIIMEEDWGTGILNLNPIGFFGVGKAIESLGKRTIGKERYYLWTEKQ
jgi:hypothetical protein